MILLPAKRMFGIMEYKRAVGKAAHVVWEKLQFRKDRHHMKFFHLSDLHIGLKLINRDLRADHGACGAGTTGRTGDRRRYL